MIYWQGSDAFMEEYEQTIVLARAQLGGIMLLRMICYGENSGLTVINYHKPELEANIVHIFEANKLFYIRYLNTGPNRGIIWQHSS